MDKLQLPVDGPTLAAVGKIAMRHGQLDYVLRMTIRTLTTVSVREALDATDGLGSYELRKQVKAFARKKIADPTALTRLDALLNRARKATEARNDILHKVWGYDRDGNPVVKDDEHRWGAIPTIQELEKIADDLAEIAAEINHARFDGFLREVLGPPT